MRTPIIVALALLVGAPANAVDEPSGCDKFKWPIERERAALTAPGRANLASGVELPTLSANGVTLALVAPTAAGLPTPPERSPKEGTFAGFVRVKTLPNAGLYTISLSAGGWVDVVQNGSFQADGAQWCHRLRRHPQDHEI